jgi:hypothetical protein
VQFTIAVPEGPGDRGARGASGGSAPATERFALEPGDAVEPWPAPQPTPRAVRLDFDLSPGDVDGLLFPESVAPNARITLTKGCLRWNGERLAPGAPRDIERIAEGVPRFTVDPECPSLHVWRNRGMRPERNREEADEERQKLRALGYIH